VAMSEPPRNVSGPHDHVGCFGWVDKPQHDPAWKDNLLFNEYFHGDNSSGLAALHQAGWTGLIADVIPPPPRCGQLHQRRGQCHSQQGPAMTSSRTAAPAGPAVRAASSRVSVMLWAAPAGTAARSEGSARTSQRAIRAGWYGGPHTAPARGDPAAFSLPELLRRMEHLL